MPDAAARWPCGTGAVDETHLLLGRRRYITSIRHSVGGHWLPDNDLMDDWRADTRSANWWPRPSIRRRRRICAGQTSCYGHSVQYAELSQMHHATLCVSRLTCYQVFWTKTHVKRLQQVRDSDSCLALDHCARYQVICMYTASQKKQDTKLLAITSPIIIRFSKFFQY